MTVMTAKRQCGIRAPLTPKKENIQVDQGGTKEGAPG